MNAISSAASAPTSPPSKKGPAQKTQAAVPPTDLTQSSSAPVKLPGTSLQELKAFRDSDQGKKLLAWAQSSFQQAKSDRQTFQTQWILNLRMYTGQQQLRKLVIQGQTGFLPQKSPSYSKPKTINRVRAFVRTECSKFQSTFPSVIAVPSTAEEEDIRAAFAAEQVWQSMVETKDLERVYARATYWMTVAGIGFTKQWWDPSACDADGKPIGDIKFESVSPFHLFVSDLSEKEMDDQRFVIQAQTRTMDWARAYYPDELEGVDMSAQTPAAGQLEEAFRVVTSTPLRTKDTVTVYEYWVKKGATPLLPNGGLLVYVGDTLVSYNEGFPYKHNQFPYSKYEHVVNDTFYADSPIVDLIGVQLEYNDLRTQIGLGIKRMGQPQLLAIEGSIVTSKLTNEPGSIISVRPGFSLPQPLPLTGLPSYIPEQQDRILADFEDMSGQHDVSKGQAPTGVSAGTALTFLKEVDDAFLTPQYKNIEQAVERAAVQALSLFNQYVDITRQLKVIGKDGSFDVLMLRGSDIASGLDVRVERGSSVGESQAAKQARVIEYFQNGLIDQPTALRLLELGGPTRLLDTTNIAARKAQRENIKMKSLDVATIQATTDQFVQGVLGQIAGNPMAVQQAAAQGFTSVDQMAPVIQQQAPPMVPVDDFDVHEVHLEEHNRYRMSQEFESLPDEIKQEFQKHVQQHEQYMHQAMAFQMMSQQAGGGQPPAAPGGGAGPAGQGTPGPAAMPATMSPDSQQALGG